jgi:hypothetical protein
MAHHLSKFTKNVESARQMALNSNIILLL